MIIGAQNRPAEVQQALAALAAIPDSETAFRVALKLADGLQTTNSSLGIADRQGILRPFYDSATRFAIDMNAVESARAQAMRLLDAVNVWDPQTSAILIAQWFSLTPRLRNELLTALTSRTDRTAALGLALQTRQILLSDVPLFQIKFLLAQPNQDVRRQAANLFGNPPVVSRQNVVDQFAAAAQMTGSKERGRTLFLARCGDCHQAGNDGNSSGLVLKNMEEMGREKLLSKTIDPNRGISEANSAFLITTRDGETLAGNVTSQNAHVFTLCRPNGELRVLGRESVTGQTPLGISAMPDGLEAGLNQQDLADLLEYLAPQ